MSANFELLPTEYRCIYCLTTEECNFESVEHIFAESLGNKFYILPVGYACERCNHGKLAWLDKELCNNIHTGFLRIAYGILNKRRRPPRLSANNLSAVWIPGKGPYITCQPNEEVIRNERNLGDGRVAFDIVVKGQFRPIILGRAVYKSALGLAALGYGHAVVCGPRFNAARAFIMKEQEFPNNLLIRTRSDQEPKAEVEFKLQVDRIGTICTITLLGLTFQFNLEPLPIKSSPMNTPVWGLRGTRFPGDKSQEGRKVGIWISGIIETKTYGHSISVSRYK